MQETVKALVRGGPAPSRPVFVPLIFAAAAKISGLRPEQFYTNPTKIANGLRQLQGPLRCDGLVCYADQTLVAEALGATIGWERGAPGIVAPPEQILPGEISGRGRVPVMLEVVRRLRAVLLDRVALAVALPGPFTTSGYLAPPGARVDGPSPAGSLAVAGNATLQAARLACEAGADLVLLIEARLPASDEPLWTEWLAILETISNVTRFHEALPVLVSLRHAAGDWRAITSRGAVPCLPAEDLVRSIEAWALPPEQYGLALPPAPELLSAFDRGLLKQRNPNCALVTTAGDLPYEIEPKNLRGLVATLRQVVTDWTGDRRASGD